MTLQDFRGQGPPGDIGTFQSPCSVIVYQYVFSGTTYTVAARQGDRGWILISYGTVVLTVIQAAANGLTAGRTSIETVVIKGELTVAGTLTLSSYTRIVIWGKLTQSTNNVAMFSIPGTVGTHRVYIQIIDGWIKGTKAGTGVLIDITYSDFCMVSNVRLEDPGAVSLGKDAGGAGDFIRADYLTRSGIDRCVFEGDGGECVDLKHSSLNVVSGNHCEKDSETVDGFCRGIILWTNSYYNVIIGNVIRYSRSNDIEITLVSHYNVVADNDSFYSGQWAIEAYDASYNSIVGNTIRQPANGGIHLEGTGGASTANYNCIVGNTCYQARGTGDGIDFVTAAAYNIIDGNMLVANNGYGVDIGAGCNYNYIGKNRFTGNVTGQIRDLGTGTILPTVRACFVKELGTAAWITTAASAMGIDIDAADEGVLAKIKLPPNLQEVVRIKVWGTAQVAEADHMMLLVVAGAGGDNEAWNAEAIAPAAKVSDTVNFANLDNVQWTFTSADDSDIGDLAAGDFLQWCCYYNVASGVDCATDLLLAGEGLEIQYV